MRALALLALACGSSSVADAGPAPECDRVVQPPSAPIVVDPPPSNPPRGASVWGAADLHAHPAGHLVSGGREDGSGGILFGRPDIAGQERGRVWIGPEDSCDGETHIRASADVATRLTQSLVFSIIGEEGHRAHTAMYARSSEEPFGAWPHSQDIYHQQMYVEMLRRAWEGGLRLMIASVTDNQSLARVMEITVAPGPIELDPSREPRSVERQVAFIETLVAENSDFMAIATSPTQARTIISGGRLAIILGLEMDWLPLEDVVRLRDEHGFRSIIPIHLADNPVGGTAAYTPVFNMHSALYSRAFGAPELQYFELIRDSCVDRRARPPLEPAFQLGLLLLPQAMDPASYFELGYESCDACAPGAIREVDLRGHRNARGIRNVAYLRQLMRMGMLVDIAHMSIASAADTIAEAERWGFPIINSHTGVSPLGEPIAADRKLPIDLARRVYRNRHGVLGLGTDGGEAEILSTLYEGEGHPLADLVPGEQTDLPLSTAPTCSPGDLTPFTRVCARAPSECSSGCDLGYVRVQFCDRSGVDLALRPDGAGGVCTPQLGRRAQEIEHIELRPRREPWCRVGSCGTYRCQDFDYTCDASLALTDPVLDEAGCRLRSPGIALPVAEWEEPRERPITLFERECAPRGCFGLNALDTPVTSTIATTVPGRHVLRIRAVPEGGFSVRVRGSSAFYQGADVRVRVEIRELAAPIEVTMNHRGLWVGDTTYDEWIVVDSEASDLHVDRVTVSIEGADPRPYSWRLASLRIDRMEDPILAWARHYDRIRAEIAGAIGPNTGIPPNDVVFAIGTDINGFVPQFPVSSVEPRDCDPFEMCSTENGRCYPLRLRERGVANYAMLGDFFAALPEPVRASVFSSADATIRAWEHAEARAASVPP